MNFTISNLESNTDGGVIVAHWRVSKTSGDFTASAYGTVFFTPNPESEDFVNYSDLTEETVIGWVQEELDTDSIEFRLDADLEEQAKPSVIVGVPW